MAYLENGDKTYSSLLNDIETGATKIPQFQRQFVWSIKDSAKLIDSIIKGYPIGMFIYWRTSERLRSIRNIGDIDLPEPKDGEFVNYVLDGQQRITSIFAALKGEKVIRENGKTEDFSEIYVNLNSSDDDEEIVTVDVTEHPELSYIKLTDLMYGKMRELNKYPEEYHDAIESYKSILQSYTFTGINLKDAEIDTATEVFTRLNVGGKSLSLFEIMVAKTYDPKRNFDLYEKFEELKSELADVKFDTISSSNVLQLISLIISRECKRKAILKLDRNEFIDIWDDVVLAVKRAIDFFISYGIAVSRLLPYNALLVPFGYFFYKHPENPTGQQFTLLEDFFWRISIGYRYSSGAEGKLVQDADKVDKIINSEKPRYEWSVDYSTEFIKENGGFSTGKSFVKALLCLMAKQKPKKFDSSELDVIIDNSWLLRANSKNYHHFFPKSYMRKNHPQHPDWFVNHIVNIVIVDDFANKYKIKAKAPARYMEEFSIKNENLDQTMKTHLIEDLDDFGVWENDYSKFFNSRVQKISELLSKKIIPQDSGDNDLEKYADLDQEEME